ncbi:MAG: hypothetical protein FJW69_08190 [Actinobacteria bacterium]|nr:hypothetical protein [Actinomycetota bacterium]
MVLEALNLFDVFVNQLGGSLFLGFLIVVVLMLMILWFSRASPTFMIVWIGLFALCWCLVFFGAIAASIAFAGAFFYFAISLYKLSSGGGF